MYKIGDKVRIIGLYNNDGLFTSPRELLNKKGRILNVRSDHPQPYRIVIDGQLWYVAENQVRKVVSVNIQKLIKKYMNKI